jgi:hypothetical protein
MGAVDMGRANAEAIELTRRHCRHARIEQVGGNSFVGNALGLPIGLMEVRCEHAQPPRTQGHQALDLAIEFYRENCIECVYRDGSGELPNLKTVVDAVAAREAERRDVEERAAAERDQRLQERRDRRRAAMAGQDAVVRELAAELDVLDRAEPRTAQPSIEERRAERHVVETARAAPNLFGPVLVDTLLGLASDTADPTAFTALRELVRGGRCPPRRALDAALVVLRQHRSPEAGDLLAFLRPELAPGDLPDVVDQLIDLASGDTYDHWRPPPAPDGLQAASEVDLSLVTSRITEYLDSDDEWTRHIAADAARVVLRQDPTRVVALGPALAASIRGPDVGYAGYPHPGGAALNALTASWWDEPTTTRSIVEAHAAGASPEVQGELARIPWLLQRFHEPWDASDPATTEVLDFLVRRAGGDWSNEAADRAVDTLESLSRDLPAVAAHVDALLGHVLALCAPEPAPAIDTSANPMAQQIAAMERAGRQMQREGRRRRLAQSVGRAAKFDPAKVLGSVLPLFTATTGDETYDRTVRTTMIDALEEAASAETLRDLLPIVYTALLSDDFIVRSAGIDLWVACSRVADLLPDELNDLASVLLADPYVAVHRRMLDQFPRLGLPDRLAPTLLPLLGSWLVTYKDKDADVVEHAIWSIRAFARMLPDEAQSTAWLDVALAHLEACDPHDRERLLMAPWPEGLRSSRAWVTAALSTASSPDLIDYYNQRSEPVLAALMDRPDLLAGIPLPQIEPLSEAHGGNHPWRAIEPVELLQAAGRWTDARDVAERVGTRQPTGAEGEPGRVFARCFAVGAELARVVVDDAPDLAAVTVATDAVREAVADLEGVRSDVRDNSPLRHALDSVLAQASAADVLHTGTVTDPGAAADELEGAAQLLATAAQPAHASGRQRQRLVDAWKIGVLLLRYDAAVRAVDVNATALLDAAKRQAEVLLATIDAERDAPVCEGLADFLAAVSVISGAADAEAATRILGGAAVPMCLVGTSLLPRRSMFGRRSREETEPPEPPLAVCVPTLSDVPVTDFLVVRPNELYSLGLMVRLVDVPEWAETCIVEPITRVDRGALTLPRYELRIADGEADEDGITLAGEDHLRCAVEQPIGDPPIDCPMVVRIVGDGREERIEVAGCTRLRLRPFDPGRDFVTEHEQTDARLLAMFGRLDSADFDTEDVRAFCRFFAACVRAAQQIMFEKTFMRGTHVDEGVFHDELERILRADPELGGRLTRRDAVAGGFDDLLHDDVIAELKVSKGSPVTVERSAKYLGQPTQYGVGRGSQLSCLVILDHGRKTSPPGVIENYIGWLTPKLHGLDDPKYPSLVGVLIINTNLPIPSKWRRRIAVVPNDLSPAESRPDDSPPAEPPTS